jgi:hypothetical protein
LVPVSFWNEMPVRWPAAPTPAMPTEALSGIGLEPADQPLEIVRRKTLFADDQQRLAADLDHRLQILQQIEGKRIETAGQHMRGRGAAQRVAVGCGANRAADTDAVLHKIRPNVRFSPKATELPRGSEKTRCARKRHGMVGARC